MRSPHSFAQASLGFYVFDYSYLDAVLDGVRGISSGGAQFDHVGAIADAFLFQTITMLVALIPLLRKDAQRRTLRGHWPWWKCIVAGVGTSVGLLIVLGVMIRVTGIGGLMESSGSVVNMTQQAMQTLGARYGFLSLFLVVSVAVPLIEEIIFRGVFLRAAVGPLGVGMAVLLQAAVFAAVHEVPAVMPILFTLALLAAWLALRSGGLIASIVLHGTNNLIVISSLSSIAARLNGAAS